jgi:chromosome partitioning protein
MIYAVVNTKGGVGKTTTAVPLATMLARTDRTLLIDGDPQASAARTLSHDNLFGRQGDLELQARIFPTRIDSRTKDAAEMHAFLHEQKWPVLSSRACERVAYRRAIGEGAIVQELGKDPPPAKRWKLFSPR